MIPNFLLGNYDTDFNFNKTIPTEAFFCTHNPLLIHKTFEELHVATIDGRL